MYIHVFAFRWKPLTSEAEKLRAAQDIIALQGCIPGLLETHVGENMSPRGQGYTFAGVMKFQDKASFDTYGEHESHQNLVRWLMPLIDPLELDFEA